ncbi:MAG: site-specific integrase [Anaerolineae bacterium]|nr:site-specific integrase [Anaerolineae bacterium]
MEQKDLTDQKHEHSKLSVVTKTMLLNERIAQAANNAAAQSRFSDYQQRKSDQTLRRQRSDLGLFQEFLAFVGVQIDVHLFEDAAGWRSVSWGLVESFVRWQLKEGYAINSINVRLSTVKSYAKLAMQSGFLSAESYAMIRAVTGFGHKEGVRIDQRRENVRVGLKKEEAVVISPIQAALLKDQPNTPQGRRDVLMMCLFLDHGLRVGEVASLITTDVDLPNGLLVFFREKVSKTQKHRMSRDTLDALNRCVAYHDLYIGGPPLPLLRRSMKNKELSAHGMSERGITHRVMVLGKQIGLLGLSAHDCRHYWATAAARHGTDPFVLQEAGGWASLAMPRRYIEENDIANAGIRLNDDAYE